MCLVNDYVTNVVVTLSDVLDHLYLPSSQSDVHSRDHIGQKMNQLVH